MPFRKFFAGLSANTYLLALSSLFADISTEMLYPVLPIFLTETLKVGVGLVGLIDGVATAIQNLAQALSGWFSDRFRRRKPIALAGYALAAASKPLIGLSTTWMGVLAARSLDRLGAGSRSAPRDALVAASADQAHRGKAFGLEGFGDNLGACLGPLICIALLGPIAISMRTIFFLAVIPGLLAFLMVAFVREKPVAGPATKTRAGVGRYPSTYWRYLAVVAVFGAGASSSSFLILRTKNLGASLHVTILVYALYNLVAALASLPAGHLSDTLGRRGVLLLSFLILVVVYSGIGFVANVVLVGACFVLYGVYQGIFRAVGKALAADLLPEHLHASGIGLFMATVGVSGFVASVVGGQLWTRVGPQATFIYGAVMALAGSVALVLIVPKDGGRRGRGDSATSTPRS